MNELQTITGTYKKQFIEDILGGMENIINNNQMMELNKSLNLHSHNLIISENPNNIDLNYSKTNKILIKEFIKNKKLKGLSSRTIQYYESQLTNFNIYATKSFIEMTSEDCKEYLKYYKHRRNCGNVSLNNVRRILSSFFRWMEIQEKIILNPMKKIPAIKEPKKVMKALTDGEIELLRKGISENKGGGLRNSAIFELLLSSGLRVGELTELEIDDISLVECKGVCMGKGGKERVFYFSERARVLLESYLDLRTDNKKWLFVSVDIPYKKLGVNGVETLLREEGRRLGIKVHPHKLRRTMATKLVRKGMPIDQVSKLLGHENLSVTTRYVETDKELLKLTHNKHTN